MEVGDILEVEIVGLNHQGKGITRVDNKVIFVSNALVSEVVKICISKVSKKFLEAYVLEYIKNPRMQKNDFDQIFNDFLLNKKRKM